MIILIFFAIPFSSPFFFIFYIEPTYKSTPPPVTPTPSSNYSTFHIPFLFYFIFHHIIITIILDFPFSSFDFLFFFGNFFCAPIFIVFFSTIYFNIASHCFIFFVLIHSVFSPQQNILIRPCFIFSFVFPFNSVDWSTATFEFFYFRLSFWWVVMRWT